MEWTNAGQLEQMLLSGGFGFLLGIYYELFRFFRQLFRSSVRAIIWQDILFFTTASAATFLFDLYLTGGMLRLYLFIGITAGFTAYYFTVGRLAFAVSRRFIRWLYAAFSILKNWLLRPWCALCGWCAKMWYPIKTQFIKKTQSISGLFSKKA